LKRNAAGESNPTLSANAHFAIAGVEPACMDFPRPSTTRLWKVPPFTTEDAQALLEVRINPTQVHYGISRNEALGPDPVQPVPSA
jgi:hypothetical protein